MTYLSRTAKLGIAAEATPSSYMAPQFTVPFLSARFNDAITQLYDRTIRATDTDLQDVQQGPRWSDWTITTSAYPDWAGWLYRAMVGPDTFTAGNPATHLFEQNRPLGSGWPSYSLTTDDGAEALGWPYTTLASVRLLVTAQGYAKLTSRWNGWPPTAAATFTEAQTAAQPLAGWGWTVTDAGGTSTRGLTLDLALTRALDIVPCVNGQQAPYVIVPGPLRATGTYTAIFDTAADLALYREAIQEPAVMTVAQPASQGGSSIAVTLSLSGWTAGTVSLEQDYVTAAYRLAGITNTTDSPEGGVASVTVLNDWNSSY